MHTQQLAKDQLSLLHTDKTETKKNKNCYFHINFALL